MQKNEKKQTYYTCIAHCLAVPILPNYDILNSKFLNLTLYYNNKTKRTDILKNNLLNHENKVPVIAIVYVA